MPQPLVIAYHLIWTCYGWWLPNDPRGSFSRTIACDVLTALGELHLVHKRAQPTSSKIRDFYDDAETLLKHALLKFTPQEVIAVAKGFAEAIDRLRYTCYA